MRTTLRIAAAVFTVPLVVAGGWADEEKLLLDKLSKSVADAVNKRVPEAELVEAAKETEGNKTEFEVSIKDDDTKIDVILTPDGKIMLIKKRIASKDLSRTVTDALDTKHPKASSPPARKSSG